MKIILLHGIGNYNPGWSDTLKADELLGVSRENIIEFNYEDLMERNWVNTILVVAARAAASYYATPIAGFAANYIQDYVDDILTYFVVPGVRKKILNRFADVLQRNPDAIVIGFSLGSIVAYETIKNFPGGNPVFITAGCPLGSPVLEILLKKFLKVKDKSRPVVKDWFNVYSKIDPISGHIEGLGCEDKDQYKIKSIHRYETYLKNIKAKLPELFS